VLTRRPASSLLALLLLPALFACAPVRDTPEIETESGLPWPEGARELTLLPGESELRILAYRDGPLAKLGHNHVISTSDIDGRVAWTEDIARGYVEMRMPVESFEIDRPELRAEEGEEFPGEIPEQDIAGTRANMLGEKLLDAENYPEIRLYSRRVRGSLDALVVDAEVVIKNQPTSVSFPLSARWEGERLIASGEVSLSQTSLGLEPFSALLGALTVRDEIELKFRFVAAPAR
jgi:polyisoprenoid-binding protein YceI